MKLTSRMTDAQINAMTKAELIEMYSGYVGPEVQWSGSKLSKGELVVINILARDRLVMEQTAEAQAAESKRLAIVEMQIVDGRVHEVLVNVKVAIDRVIGESQEVLNNFRDDVANNLAIYAIEHSAEATMSAGAMIGNLTNIATLLTNQIEKQTLTSAELTDRFEQVLEFFMDRALESGYRPNSTSPMYNMKAMCEFNATQRCAHIMRNLCRVWGEILSGKREPSEAKYMIRDRRTL